MCDECTNCNHELDSLKPEYPYNGKWTEAHYFAPMGIQGAALQVRKAGQQKPSEGDRVLAIANIMLPEIDGKLAPGYQYEERCVLAGQALTADWGESVPFNGMQMRVRTLAGTGDTWKEAFEGIHADAYAELEKLKVLLDVRAEALKRAES